MSASSSSSSLVVLGTAEALDTATSPWFNGSGADSWAAVEKIRSMTSEVELRRKCANTYKLPKEYTVLCANDWPPCRTPAAGSNAVCIYESMLEAGIRLPLHEFYSKVLRHYSLAPSQLCPNAWRFLAGFVLLCEGAGVAPAKAVFRYFFKLCAHAGDQQGWYYFAPFSCKRHLFNKSGGGGSNLPSNDGWKKRFFFVDVGPAGVPWRCPRKWGTPSAAACGEPVLTEEAWVVISKLEEEAKKDDIDLIELLYESRSQRSLPVLRPPPVKEEATDAGAAFSSWPMRKRKSFSGFCVTPPQQTAGAGTSSPPDFACPWPSSGELSVTQLVCQLMQKAEADLNQTKEELVEAREEHAAEVARLKEELSAAKAEHSELKMELGTARAEHAAEIVRLKTELGAAEADRVAEIVQLETELGAAKAEHAVEVAQLGENLEAEKAKRIAKIGEFAEELRAAETRHANTLALLKAEQSKVRQLTEQLQAWNAEHTSAVGLETTALRAAQEQHAAVVRQLTAQHQAAEMESAAEARRLAELLQTAEAEGAQLREQLEGEKARHADEVAAIRVDCQNKVINAEHMSSSVIGELLRERYAAGLRHMRDLVLQLYPGAVDASRLTPAALAPSVPPGFQPRDQQAPPDQ